jgi:predicted ribosome quality control (RQC) complex YloA/Tae2 family protein
MPLSVEENRAIVEELDASIPGARVEKVQERDPESFVLTLSARHLGDDAPRRLFILLSARRGFERVHAIEERGPIRDDPGPFVLALRRRLPGARVMRVRQPGRGLAVEIDLAHQREGGRPEELILAADLASGPSNLVLLEKGRRLATSLRPVRSGGEDLEEGARYGMEGPPPQPAAMAGVAASPWRYLPVDDRQGPEDAVARLFPLNIALGRYYAGAEAAAVLEERRAVLARSIRQAIARRRTLLGRLEEDLKGVREGEAGLRLGELLKAEMPHLRKGMDRIEAVDYYDPALPRIVIPLDPTRTPLENIERFFHRYKKALRAVPIIGARKERVAGEIARLEEAGRDLSGAADETAMAAIEGRVGPLTGRPRASRPQAAEDEGVAGPRRFTSRDGAEILVGRSARENDHLTFHLARGNDVFLHVSGRPGAHVVARASKDRPPSLETLLDGACLAIYYSLPVRSRSEAARGVVADVDYVEVKHVRKPRGAAPGEVLLARHKTLRVALEEERLSRLMGGTPTWT